jgi:hypothetical protein
MKLYIILENGFNLTGEAHTKEEAKKIIQEEKKTSVNSVFVIQEVYLHPIHQNDMPLPRTFEEMYKKK